jgi:hypothetical protein
MPRLILVAWEDGHVVWSEDRYQGGPPYLEGDVPPERLVALLERADRDGVFRDKRLGQPCLGPDSRFTTILFKRGDQRLEMQSWHESAEHAGRLAASSCALVPLAGLRRLEVVREEQPEYLYYRAVWGELRTLVSSLAPAQNRSATGGVFMKGGTLSWRDGAAR